MTDKQRAYSRRPEVKERHRAQQAEYRKKPGEKERISAYMKTYVRRPEVVAARRARLQRPDVKEKNRASNKKSILKCCYGLTPDEYEAMFVRQRGKCAACGSSDWGAKGPHIDHDHATGRVRGILCRRCNLILGLADDSQAVLVGAAVYLEQNDAK